MIEPEAHVQVCRDPDDDKFIDYAMASHSIYIVCGGKDLLSIEKYRDRDRSRFFLAAHKSINQIILDGLGVDGFKRCPIS